MKHNWEYKKLGEVCNFIGGGTPSKSNDGFYTGSIPWATVRDMLTFKLFKTELCITKEAVNNSATNILPKGMIVISTHVGLGKICELMQDTAINQDLKGISFTDNSIDKYFFTYWYRSIANFIISKGRGATVKGVTLDFMRGLNIPVPPLSVQEQIVGELDKINELIDDCRELLRTLDNLAQSIFYDSFGDPVTNPKGWEVKSIQGIAKTTAGGTPSKTHDEYYTGGDILWLRSGEVCRMNITDTELRITELGLLNSSAKLVPVNSVVVAMYGATAAQVGIIRNEMALNQAICAILPNKYTDPIYLYFCLSSLKDCLIKVAHGAAQPNISQAIIKTTQISVPPLELQETFAKRIEAIEAIKATTQQQLAALQTLLDSRMDYWFN